MKTVNFYHPFFLKGMALILMLLINSHSSFAQSREYIRNAIEDGENVEMWLSLNLMGI